MNRVIRKIAILGSGVMGSRIAAHFANIGVQVLLLDITPSKLNDEEIQKGLTLEDPAVRNRIVNSSFESTRKSKPNSFYHKDYASRVSLGNFEDDLQKISECDWIMEVVVENLEIKKSLFEKVEKHRKPGTIITSNTSGIPIHLMAEGRSGDFRKNFCGTHFFNPPRYLPLLEIIPTPETDSALTDFLMYYGDRFLGKTTVLCKDTPAFIANRVGVYAILKVVETMKKLNLTIDEIDKLTGPVIGRPKSATFRTSDIVGLDTLIKVTNNLYQALGNDESRETFKLPAEIDVLQNNNWLGDKSGQGFYKKSKDSKGNTQILTLDLESMEYKPKSRVKFDTLEKTKPIENIRERFKILLGGKDKAGEFYRSSFYALFQYASNRIPEIADELYKIDDAVCAGFGWELGPFETWDSANLQKSLPKMEEAGYKPNQWVYDMITAGAESFYTVQDGVRKYWDINSKQYLPLPGKDEFIILDNIRENKKVWGNAGTTLFDVGDGILNLEFHTKMNTMGEDVIRGVHHAIDTAEKDFRGLVIGNQGTNFSAGANLGVLFMLAIEQEYDEINFSIKHFQDTMMRVRYSSIPVVVAPHALSLGGGCEMTLHGDRVQAAAETYIGLVEVGVGLIPAGGGTKELTKRVSDGLQEGDVELNALQNAFMNIATAKVATSAHEAFDMNILRRGDGITLNKDRQIADAKKLALELADAGYVQPVPASNIKVQGRTGMALFYAGINGMKMGNYITEHDMKIARKIANVMCGGDLSYPQEVSEQYLLDLEREAFLSLTGEKKTLERIQAILQGQKPLRN
jgi:3-hydroxyacyl-CoA dehydrogenase